MNTIKKLTVKQHRALMAHLKKAFSGVAFNYDKFYKDINITHKKNTLEAELNPWLEFRLTETSFVNIDQLRFLADLSTEIDNWLLENRLEF